ncbi:MFS transporter [Paracoccus marcusii]|uniref:MFS transporter n=1 Tax=Paracoccus marcusii TaxID=59779 RepID=UPI002ED004C8
MATPILTGSVSRLFLGIWTEKYGGRLVFSSQMLLTAIATWALTLADTYVMYLVAALGIGLAGGSFIIGVAYVSRWYDAGHQGTALGIFGAGNVGAAVTKFVAPFVMVAYGWHGVAYVWAAGLAILGCCSSFWRRTIRNWSPDANRAPRRHPWRSNSRR